MKSSELLLFFFIIYSILSNIIFMGLAYFIYRKKQLLEIYNEELLLELVKMREK